MKRVLLVCALYCLATVAANSTVIWNVTLPNPTASPANGEDAPTPHAVISKALGLYAYVDTQYNVNVVNLTDGTHLWAHTVAGNLGLQFVEAYNQLVFNSLTFNTLQGRDAVTGAVVWSQASNFTANLPAFLYKGRFLTAQLQTGQNTSDMYQVDLATGKTVWQLPGPVNFNGECGQGITIFNSGNPAEFYAFGANLTTGNITWANTAVWGSWFGCLQNKAGAPVAIIKNEIANGHILAVVDPVSGHTIRNITVERYLHADQVFGSVGSIFCANTVRGQSEDYQPFVVCYDVDTGNVTMSLNINDEPVQDAYVLDGHVVLLKRNTSNGASVVLTAYNPTTAALVWNITTSTPGPIDVYYVPGNALIGSYVVVNHDDGFTALSHRKGSFNVTGLGTTVRVDSIRTTDDFATNAIVTTRYNGIRLKL